MEVKVQCECGTRFAFDVEPVNGRMPVRVKCPECGADGTDLANEVIRQKLGAVIPVSPVAIAATPTSAPAPPPQTAPAPVQQPMRVAAPPPAAVPVAAAASITFCPRHLKNPAKETCRVCGKPICEECMAAYGYVCSTFCRKRAEETGIELPVYAKQRSVIEARIARLTSLAISAVVVLVVIVAGAWLWYTFWGSRPRVIYSEKLPHGDRARFYQLLPPHQVLSIKATQMRLYDVAEQKQLWSVPLNVGFAPPPPPDSSRPNIEEPVKLYPQPRVFATTNDLWILFPERLIRYDRRSGNSKQEIPMTAPIFDLTESDGGITIVSADESEHQTVTRIQFADGSVQTESIEPATAAAPPAGRQPKPPGGTLSLSANSPAKPATPGKTAPPVAPAKPPAGPLSTAARILAAATNALPIQARAAARESLNDKFIVDGSGLVQMKVDLLEHKTITHEAMKQPKKSLVDNNLTAGQSMEAVEREMNEMRREQTGGVEEEDVSRYQVTLRRLPAGTTPDWTGEAVGPPAFYPLKTRSVLVSGKIIQVFDKNNKRLWSANLTYSVAPRYSGFFATESEPPCVEAGNTLYVFDRGMLTSFEAATGDVHWRLTSVGISQVQLDEKKNLYVTSTTASPDTIQFSQQVSFSSRAAPVILKVEAATGKVLWRNESLGDACYVSGPYVYISRAAQSPLTTIGEEPILYFDLYRLSPSDGHAMWDYSQSRRPVQIEAQGNEILLHFRGELQVVKFLSL